MAAHYICLTIFMLFGGQMCQMINQGNHMPCLEPPHLFCNHQSTPIIQWNKLTRSKFLGTRIPYTRNSCASFQIDILVAGDINPNPGPETPRFEQTKSRLVYTSEQLLALNSYNGTRKSLPKLQTDVWTRITSLGIRNTG